MMNGQRVFYEENPLPVHVTSDYTFSECGPPQDFTRFPTKATSNHFAGLYQQSAKDMQIYSPTIPAAAAARQYSFAVCPECQADRNLCDCWSMKRSTVKQTAASYVPTVAFEASSNDDGDEQMENFEESQKTKNPGKRLSSKRETVAALNTHGIFHNSSNLSTELRAKVQIKPARKTAKYFISYFPPKLYCSPYKYDVLITLPAAVFKTYRLAFRLIDGESNQQIIYNTKSETSILVEKSKTIRKGTQVGFANASYRFCFNICSFHNLRRPFVLTAHLLKLKENEEEHIDEHIEQDPNEEHHYDHHDERNICKEKDGPDVICVYESEPFHIFARKTNKSSETWGEANNLREQMKAKSLEETSDTAATSSPKRSKKVKKVESPRRTKKGKRSREELEVIVKEEPIERLAEPQPTVVIEPRATIPILQEDYAAPANFDVIVEPEPLYKKMKLGIPQTAAQQRPTLIPPPSPLSLLSPTTPSIFSFPNNVIDYNAMNQAQANTFGKMDVANMYNQLNNGSSQVPSIHSNGLGSLMNSEYYQKCVLEDFFNNDK
jgi:hypothetical protein